MKTLLLDCHWVHAKLRTASVTELLANYDLAAEVLHPTLAFLSRVTTPTIIGPQTTAPGPSTETEAAVANDRDTQALQMIQGAIRLSAHVTAKDPAQFASQIVGRLLPLQDVRGIEQFTARLIAGAPKPWLRPLRCALHPPGTSLIRILEGHSGAVNGVALNGNGRLAVSASADKTLKVWVVESGVLLATFHLRCGRELLCVHQRPQANRRR